MKVKSIRRASRNGNPSLQKTLRYLLKSLFGLKRGMFCSLRDGNPVPETAQMTFFAINSLGNLLMLILHF